MASFWGFLKPIDLTEIWDFGFGLFLCFPFFPLGFSHVFPMFFVFLVVFSFVPFFVLSFSANRSDRNLGFWFWFVFAFSVFSSWFFPCFSYVFCFFWLFFSFVLFFVPSFSANRSDRNLGFWFWLVFVFSVFSSWFFPCFSYVFCFFGCFFFCTFFCAFIFGQSI